MNTYDQNGRGKAKAKVLPAQPGPTQGLTETSFRGETPLKALQAHAAPAFGLQGSGQTIHQAAQEGLRTPASTLPYADQIAASFGRHDVSQISSHVGPAATASAAAMNATGYATGDHVVFAGTPNLHTVAHEAAHVVQQKGGVQLSGGIGQVGDTYEIHADAVAERVTAGQSAEGLLDQFAGPSPTQGAVQRTWRGALGGAVTGGLTGLLTAGPAGLVGGVLGGAVLGHIGSEAVRDPSAFGTPWESEREYDDEEEDEEDDESGSESEEESGSDSEEESSSDSEEDSDDEKGDEQGGEQKNARQRKRAGQKARLKAKKLAAPKHGLKKGPAKPKKPRRAAAGAGAAAAAAGPAPIPQAVINNEVQRIMDIIDGSSDEGNHLQVRSDLPTRARPALRDRLRALYHNQPARGAHNRRYYVGNSLSRGLHVTIHKWNAAGVDTRETVANYHIEL